ncbi:MFS transporter [Mesorhizobium sp. CO1-1-8]|uniref:MFS transporter n=1 Tax=Mesorhizobium sp. CO1-1-8 TaxID=2876631 RepID=UPI001CD15A2C|nr:MFS transporter [Mesorhizobium sp. CO1-1-8]MBZ9772265.1 MFS transporter [Mesorhizobium sp. CO1-1-8]
MNGGAEKLRIFPLASSCALAVSVTYVSQPVLPLIGISFGQDASAVGLIITLTQVGYATGLLFLVPLADRIARRKLIKFLVFFNLLSALACAVASSFLVLLAASFFLGASAVTAQIIIPTVSGLTPAPRRGRVIGALLSGMAAGPLLARIVSGLVASSTSWREVFFLAATLDTLLLTCILWALPTTTSTSDLSWSALMRSLVQLLRQSRPLREACFCGATMFGVFSAVWASLASLLARPPYNFPVSIIGLFGLIGIVSIVSAPVTGSWVDKAGSRHLLISASAVSLFAVCGLAMFGTSLFPLIACLGCLDLANRVSLVANQARSQDTAGEARARVNTVFMASYFLGGAVGAAAGSFAVSHAAWMGLGVVGSLLSIFAMVVSVRSGNR